MEPCAQGGCCVLPAPVAGVPVHQRPVVEAQAACCQMVVEAAAAEPPQWSPRMCCHPPRSQWLSWCLPRVLQRTARLQAKEPVVDASAAAEATSRLAIAEGDAAPTTLVTRRRTVAVAVSVSGARCWCWCRAGDGPLASPTAALPHAPTRAACGRVQGMHT